MIAGGTSQTLSDLLARNHPDGIEVEGESTPMWADPNFANYSIHTYGAHFAEVGVDADTGEIRLREMLGVFSPGRVLNAKTARSQLIGGMTFGVGMALLEEAVVDLRSGAFVNCDLAGYLVPVNADIPMMDAVILDGFDDKANVLGVKGLGELGICGAGAAIGNAVFNATACVCGTSRSPWTSLCPACHSKSHLAVCVYACLRMNVCRPFIPEGVCTVNCR